MDLSGIIVVNCFISVIVWLNIHSRKTKAESFEPETA